MNAALDQQSLEPVARRTTRRIARRLAPFLFILYVFNYIDRVNVSYAALQMTGELHFSNAVFGFGAGVFFIGYFLFQIPQTMLVELWSARKYIGATLVGWGALATFTGLISSAHQFYWIRFFLGVAEAGFFPGVIVYLTHWYRYEDRAKAVAMFMLAIPMSNLLGATFAVFLMKIHWFGYGGWRWLLMLEGFPAVLTGLATFFYLTDRPKDAKWLAEDERNITLRQRMQAALDFAANDLPNFEFAIGPEGGWTSDELALFAKYNWLPATLGPRILRAETAAISALAIASAMLI